MTVVASTVEEKFLRRVRDERVHCTGRVAEHSFAWNCRDARCQAHGAGNVRECPACGCRRVRVEVESA